MYDTSFTGSNIIRLSSVDSTNAYAANLIKETAIFEGTVIVAREQTLGKGQMGNQWLSEPGKNLTFSLVLYPKTLSASDHFSLSQVTALAISDLLIMYGIDNCIKWPNDIFTQKGKIAGILIENQFQDFHLKHSIVGIGLNINQLMNNADFRATSMIDHLGEEMNPEEVLKSFCRFFDKWYLMLNAGQADLIKNSYLLRLLNFGKAAPYVYKGEKIIAVISGIEPNGKLTLRTDEFIIYADLKEISFVL
jgi:BirA family biotin operon repressor/biotin-[acetyl-CoA-carboxylase] ligase